MPPPIIPAAIATVKIPAPTLSFIVMGDMMMDGMDGPDEPDEPDPAPGSLVEVAPVRSVSGAMLGRIKFAPMTDNAHICPTEFGQ